MNAQNAFNKKHSKTFAPQTQVKTGTFIEHMQYPDKMAMMLKCLQKGNI